MSATPDLQKPMFYYALYPRDHDPVSARHLLLSSRRGSNNFLVPVRLESVHRLGEFVEGTITCVPVMHGDGQAVEVMYGGFVEDSNADIAVPDHHGRRQVYGDKDCPALPKKFHATLQVYPTDERSVVADISLRDRSNAPVAEQVSLPQHHLCHMTERQSGAQVAYN